MKRPWKIFLLIVVMSLVFGLAVNPKKFPPSEIPVIGSIWNWFQNQNVHLGLDLQGGTQLDFEIDLSEAKARNGNTTPDDDVKIPELIEGVKEVIENRVNSLGVSEPNIYLSQIGDEQHIVVELAGVKDINEAKEKVGKVVLLEFKEEKTELDNTEEAAIKSKAQELLRKAQSGTSFSELAAQGGNIKVEYKDEGWQYKDEVNRDLQSRLFTGNPRVIPEVVSTIEGYTYTGQGLQSDGGYNVVRLIEKRTVMRKDPKNAEAFTGTSTDYIREKDIPEEVREVVTALGNGEVSDVLETKNGFSIYKVDEKLERNAKEESIRASHILVKTESTKAPEALKPVDPNAPDAKVVAENKKLEAENAKIAAENKEIEKRNEEARKRAEELLVKAKASGADFAALAKEYSEDTSKDVGGDLGFFAKGKMVAPFEEKAFSMKIGEMSGLVKSDFGYHIILVTDKKKPSEAIYKLTHMDFSKNEKDKADAALKRVREEVQVKYERLFFSTTPDPWKATGLDGRYFQRADVAYDQNTFQPFVSITFNNEGAKMFEDLTGRNVGKPIAIFVGGEFISAPRVNEKIAGGKAQITLGQANLQLALKEANELARNLNAGSIPAPLKKPSELNISSSLGSDALARSMYAATIGVLSLCIYMILYYRFAGLLACVALSVYALMLMFVIQSEIPSWFAHLFTGALWLYFVTKIFLSRSDIWSKMLFILMSVCGIFFVASVLANPIVLTLAGIAGVVLSIGMAVDANILIFERMKEEFRIGRDFVSAVEVGFARAWSSILDSNVSSLITCGVLYFFGSSIIRGFAVNLAVGILISMFTAITVTKTLLLLFAGTKLSKVKWLWARK